jgi:hypothetical protein
VMNNSRDRSVHVYQIPGGKYHLYTDCISIQPVHIKARLEDKGEIRVTETEICRACRRRYRIATSRRRTEPKVVGPFVHLKRIN